MSCFNPLEHLKSYTTELVGICQMLKLTKKADYGLIAMRHLASCEEHTACSAKEIADCYGIPQEALAKILQRLAKAKLLISQHGINGGYALAREARSISAFEVIKAIEGPLFITSCTTSHGDCMQSLKCTVREPLRKVSETIQQVLTRMKISDMLPESHEAGSEPEPSLQAQADLVTLS